MFSCSLVHVCLFFSCVLVFWLEPKASLLHTARVVSDGIATFGLHLQVFPGYVQKYVFKYVYMVLFIHKGVWHQNDFYPLGRGQEETIILMENKYFFSATCR